MELREALFFGQTKRLQILLQQKAPVNSVDKVSRLLHVVFHVYLYNFIHHFSVTENILQSCAMFETSASHHLSTLLEIECYSTLLELAVC